MKNILHNLIRFLVLLALLTTAAVALAQDEAETATAEAVPFIGVRYWEVAEGILVTGIVVNTPAAEADLVAGDIILSCDGADHSTEAFLDMLMSRSVGEDITLCLDRDGEPHFAAVTLSARPDDLFTNPDYAMPLDLAALGLYVHQCGQKVYIVAALTGSAVAEAGFQPYDRLLSVDGAAVDSIGAADVAVSYLEEGDDLTFTILRGGSELSVTVAVEDQRKRRHRPRPRLETSEIYQTNGIELAYGADLIEVRNISPEHALYAAGLRQYDLISAANGAPLDQAENFFAGDSIALTVDRAGRALFVDAPASAAPLLMLGLDAPAKQDRSQWLDLHEKQVNLGVRFVQLEADSPYFGDSAIRNGALVVEVIEGLPAGAAGIQVGDIIVAVDGEPATLEIDLRNRIYFHNPGDTVTLDLLRAGEMMQVEVTLRVAS